jgi:hypothetical protein
VEATGADARELLGCCGAACHERRAVKPMPSSQVRETVLEALHQFHRPMAYQDLTAYMRSFFPHETAFSGEEVRMLMSEERRGYQAGKQRPVWICPAILDSPGFAADTSLLTRSDWPLTLRVVAAVG